MAPRWQPVLLLTALCLAPALYEYVRIADAGMQRILLLNWGARLVAFLGTVRMVPVVKAYTLRKGMCGFDINKVGTPAGEVKVPESLGLVTGMMFVIATILFQFYLHTEQGADSRAQSQYSAALFSITFQVFLGFVDDVLDVPWRVKLVLPTIASLPLVMAYAGHTAVVVPKPLRAALGMDILELGLLYKVYMLLLSVFCTNSINILAGINGLEAGQTLVMAAAVLALNLGQLARGAGELGADARSAHLFSACLMSPLAATTAGLLLFNWYPSEVFVGDTFTYFAGMVFAVAGILGHFSETLLLFFLPQVINFVYSIPQLLRIVPCPRHRLPKYDRESGLLHATPNLNLVNLALRVGGPTTEQRLCVKLLAFQALCCAGCFGARRALSGWYK